MIDVASFNRVGFRYGKYQIISRVVGMISILQQFTVGKYHIHIAWV